MYNDKYVQEKRFCSQPVSHYIIHSAFDSLAQSSSYIAAAVTRSGRDDRAKYLADTQTSIMYSSAATMPMFMLDSISECMG